MAARIIQTRRLCMQPVADYDTDPLHALWIDPPIRRFLWNDQVIARVETRRIIRKSTALFEQNGFGLWVFRPPQTQDLIGFGGFSCFREPSALEIALGVAAEWRGQGLATEAGDALIRLAFITLGFSSVIGVAQTANSASLRLVEKLGMQLECRYLTDGIDTAFYRLESARWHLGGMSAGTAAHT